MSKPAPIEVRRVQVRELRAGFRALRKEGKPVFVMVNSATCGLFLPIEPPMFPYYGLAFSRKKALRDAFEVAFLSLND